MEKYGNISIEEIPLYATILQVSVAFAVQGKNNLTEAQMYSSFSRQEAHSQNS